MKMPTFLRPKKKLRATAARRSIELPDEMDYEQMAEPNMKLSRALLIVLVLHVVAVAGIIAFNTIKPREHSLIGPQQTKTDQATAAVSASPTIPKTKAAHSPEKIVAKIGPKTDEPKRVEKAIAVTNSSKTYVVEKGDNPVKIAKKFHVPYDELVTVNHIDDPHKLKPGQKLIIPAKSPPKAKKVTESD